MQLPAAQGSCLGRKASDLDSRPAIRPLQGERLSFTFVGTAKTFYENIGAPDGKEQNGTRLSTRQQGDRGDFKT